MTDISESLRTAMRHWPSGVCVVTSRLGTLSHGMTVNSFTSVSLEPPLVLVALGHDTRTYQLILETEVFAITVLSQDQAPISNRFAGVLGREEDRFVDLEVFTLKTGSPLIMGGLSFIDCKVRYQQPFASSTLLIGEVVAVQSQSAGTPLVYQDRMYRSLSNDIQTFK